MCIGIPMQVIEGDDWIATCEGRGERRQLSLALVGEQPPGTWVLAFLDAAREVLTAEEAATINEALDALDTALAGGDTAHFFQDLQHDDPQGPLQ